MSGPFVEIADGHRLFVRDWGEGAPVVLLAGWGMHSGMWGSTMAALNAMGLRTIAYDRRGHGRSSDPGRTSYDLLADDLAAVLEALEIEGATLVCHSGSGGEALRYVARHGSARLARIVLVGATGPRMMADTDGGPGATPAMLEARLAHFATDLAGWIDGNTEPFAPGASPHVLRWLGDMVMESSLRSVIDFQRVIAETDLTADAVALDLPVTIIHGDRDVSAPIDLTARRYAEIVRDAELLVYEGVAHGVMITHAQRLATDIASRIVSPAG